MNGSWFVFEGILRGAVQLARNNKLALFEKDDSLIGKSLLLWLL
jgi:hypothetical protein